MWQQWTWLAVLEPPCGAWIILRFPVHAHFMYQFLPWICFYHVFGVHFKGLEKYSRLLTEGGGLSVLHHVIKTHLNEYPLPAEDTWKHFTVIVKKDYDPGHQAAYKSIGSWWSKTVFFPTLCFWSQVHSCLKIDSRFPPALWGSQAHLSLTPVHCTHPSPQIVLSLVPHPWGWVLIAFLPFSSSFFTISPSPSLARS